jgi:hypothetical protein
MDFGRFMLIWGLAPRGSPCFCCACSRFPLCRVEQNQRLTCLILICRFWLFWIRAIEKMHRGKSILALTREARVAFDHYLRHTHHVGDLAGISACPTQSHYGEGAQPMQYKPSLLQWRKGRPRIAFAKPLVGNLLPRERQAVLLEQDEGRPSLPAGDGGREFLGERHPDHEAGFLLRDVDAHAPADLLEIRPAHLDEVGATLPGVGGKRDNPRQVRPGVLLRERDLRGRSL